MAAQPLIRATDDGLFCDGGGFHIDPWRPVERAVVTHAHSDHAAPGCRGYLCAAEGAGVLRLRVGPGAAVETVAYGEGIEIGGVRVSLHPAGHILGSAQVRVEHGGDVWVVSGDYKTQPDPTCAPFEPVRCRVFITESTFALPVYRWPAFEGVARDVNDWWRENQRAGRTSVVFAYALGKAQRVLAALDPEIGPIGAHGAVLRVCEAYAGGGVRLPPTLHATGAGAGALRGRGLVVAPPSAAGTGWLRRLAAGREGLSTAFASGWMRVRGARRRRGVDRGFVISDHADWPGLLGAIDATGAERVGVTHGFTAVLVRWLTERGRDAFAIETRYEGEHGEEAEEGRGTETEGQRDTAGGDVEASA